MKTIKQGKYCQKPIEKEYVEVCPNCGCEFAYKLTDIKLSERRINGSQIIDCPNASCMIEIEVGNGKPKYEYKTD